ncbi:MAG: ATP-binding protein [Mucilaginibacter sp.]
MKSPQKLVLAFALIGIAANAQAQHSLKQIWATDTVLKIPESVLYAKTVLYTSLIDGEPWAKDGKGEIAKVSPAGKVINANWITGLNAPKGLGIKGDILYVADMDELVAISISKGKIDRKIKIPGSENLNDVTIDDKGAVYVTDTKVGKVYKVVNNTPSVLFDNMKGANGLKAIGNKLYILDGDGMYVSTAGGKPTKITALPHGGDGIEPIGNGDFLVTEWDGYFYYVKANGTKQLLLDTHTTNKRTADIGYNPATRTVYLPTFSGKSIVAYKLN